MGHCFQRNWIRSISRFAPGMLRVVLALAVLQLSTAQKCSPSEFEVDGKCVCVAMDHGIHGHNIRNKAMQSDIDYNMCMAICQRRPDCEFIVYRLDRRNCSLKKKSGGKHIQRFKGYITATKGCLEAPKTSEPDSYYDTDGTSDYTDIDPYDDVKDPRDIDPY